MTDPVKRCPGCDREHWQEHKPGCPRTFDEAPTVTTARPAAAALVAEHVEENLRLHARVNELEASMAAAERQLEAFGESTMRLVARAEAAEARVRELEGAAAMLGHVRLALETVPEIDPDGEGPTHAECEAMGAALIAINEAVTA